MTGSAIAFGNMFHDGVDAAEIGIGIVGSAAALRALQIDFVPVLSRFFGKSF